MLVLTESPSRSYPQVSKIAAGCCEHNTAMYGGCCWRFWQQGMLLLLGVWRPPQCMYRSCRGHNRGLQTVKMTEKMTAHRRHVACAGSAACACTPRKACTDEGAAARQHPVEEACSTAYMYTRQEPLTLVVVAILYKEGWLSRGLLLLVARWL